MKLLELKEGSELSLVERYIVGLKKAYMERGGESKWNTFEAVVEGAPEEQLRIIQELYPKVPNSLLELLRYVDGTYYREYKGHKILLYFLGSNLEEYPYYLLSSQEIIENQMEATEYYSEYVNREFDPEDVWMDDKIIDNAEKMKWLHFSDCMNNGGTSQLFLDFSPSKSGKVGQVVMYVHDPDRMEVIADSFDAYLEKMISGEFDFINEEWMDE